MKISVALCTYNGEKYIAEQLCSIFCQDEYFIDEIQIGDDGSTDHTIDIIQEFQAKYGKIHLTVNDERLGPVKNFERTIMRCQGDYICLSDQDDVWHPDKLKVLIPILENDNTIQACFTNASLIDGEGEPIDGCLWQAFGAKRNEECLLTTDRILEFILRFGNVVTGATLVLKSACRDKILPFYHRYGYEYHDWMIASQLAMNKEIYPVDQELISYRIHEKQQAGIPRSDTWDTIFDIRKNILGKRFDNVSYSRTLAFTWNYFKNTINELRFYKEASGYLLKRCFVEARREWASFKRYQLIPSSSGSSHSDSKSSICFFVGYSDSGVTAPEDMEYIRELQKHFCRVIVLTNYQPSDEVPGYEYMLLENKGYDFGFFYQAVRRMNVAYYHTVGFVNNSNRLVRGASLHDFFSWCRLQRSSFCGITDSYQAPEDVDPRYAYHLQSHLLVFKGRAIEYLLDFFDEIDFRRFFSIENKTTLRRFIIKECEIGLTRYMIRRKVKPVSWMKSEVLCSEMCRSVESVNPHIDFWEEMIQRGYPLMKKKLISGKWDNLIRNADNISKYL